MPPQPPQPERQTDGAMVGRRNCSAAFLLCLSFSPSLWLRWQIHMNKHPTDRESLERDCDLEFFVAGGPGGQHRNKVETGVRLTHRPTGIVVTATERRSQSANREAAYRRMAERLEKLQRPRKPRKATKPTAGSKRERVERKRKQSERKRGRAKWRAGDAE
jgi:ribosome-associated protein